MPVHKKCVLIACALIIVLAFAAGFLGCSPEKTSLPVVLFSDFGSGDYRVSQLKGIILNRFPGANMIDASHGVPAFDVPTGAFMLYMAAREFPGKVVFVAVVNPYSKPEPAYLVLTTNKEQIFVLPDNGLLTYVAKDMGIKSLYKIDTLKLFSKPLSELSAERIEGTVGALIASGYTLEKMGPAVINPETLDIQEPAVSGNQLLGTVIFVDNFGNCATNISPDSVSQFGLASGASIQIATPSGPVPALYGAIYSDVPTGKEVVFVNPNLAVVQLSINMGNFADKYKLKAGSKIGLQKTSP